MTREEFVDLHGVDLWDKLVCPLQKQGLDQTQRNNANIIVHQDILMPLVRKMSTHAKGMKEIT